MANFKIVISDSKTREAYQKEVEQNYSGLIGKKIGENVSGNNLGLPGFELEITGGSDKDGFPMRKDIAGSARKKVILSMPPGFHPERKGQRKRKSVRGNTVSADIVQVNAKILKHGPKSMEELFGIKPKEEKKEEKAEAKAEAKHEEKKEHKPPEHKEEHKKGEPKPEKKEETAEQAEKKMGVKKIEE